MATQMEQTWKAFQQELTAKSSNGKQIIAERSDHMINHYQPEIIVEAIREMVNEVRANPVPTEH